MARLQPDTSAAAVSVVDTEEGPRNYLGVTIPPPVTADEAAAVIAAIRSRHESIDDPHLWRFPDDPAGVLDYLRKYVSEVPDAVQEADLLDGLRLGLRLWWIGVEAEGWLLERARRLDVPHRRVAERLGIGPQGVADRRDAARRKMEKLTGVPRPAAMTGRNHCEQAEHAWLALHREAVLHIARTALTHRDLASDEAAEWLADVAQDVRGARVTPGTLQTLRFALDELATSPEALTVGPDHPLREVLNRWSQLYADRETTLALVMPVQPER